MPVIAAVLYWVRVLRRPLDARLKRARLGAFLIIAGAMVVVGLWVDQRPPGLHDAYFWGELIGVLAVYAMSWSLLTATRARSWERWFGGLDRMYLWHKRTAIVGAVLLVPHKVVLDAAPDEIAGDLGIVLGIVSAIGLAALVLISLARLGRLLRLSYERWLVLHRLTGLFLIVGVAHGLLIDRVIAQSVPLRVAYLAIGATGTASYLYAELLMRRRQPTAAYEVTTVTRPDDTTVDLRLRPRGPGLSPRPGQFVFLGVGGNRASTEHPFSLAGVGPGGELRLTIRSRGDHTRRLHTELQPGQHATIAGPFGMFDHTLGGPEQIWIAGGIGIAPFLGWIDGPLPERIIDVFYSSASEADAHYLPEIAAAAAEPTTPLRLHTILTDSQPRLITAGIAAAIDGPIENRHVFLCGPATMTTELRRGLRRAGVPRDQIHAEFFAFR